MKIHLKNISKIFTTNNIQHRVLSGINLKLEKKEITVILGHSGSGKSTLLRIINLLDKPSEGEIYFNNTQIKEYSHNLFSKIGMVFQQFHLFPHFNVKQNLTYALRKNSQKISNLKIDNLAENLLKRFNIESRMYFFPKDLSGGEKQRAAICRALMMKPELIMFDEPTSALDVENIRDVIDIMNELKKEMNILIVTHDIKFAKIISDRIIFMDQGKILEDRNSEAFFAYPQSNRGKVFLKNVENLII